MSDPAYTYTWARAHWPTGRLGQPCAHVGRPDPRIRRVISVQFQDGTTISCTPPSIRPNT